MFIIFSVFYILIAASMIVLILIQRGDGADAGSGFGGGASGTVFGARGSTNFLSRSTAALAGLFFLLSLGMAIYLHKTGNPQPVSDLGVMSGISQTAKPASSATTDVPRATAGAVQSGAAATPSDVPRAMAPKAATSTDVPAAPAAAKPAAAGKPQGKPAPTKKN